MPPEPVSAPWWLQPPHATPKRLRWALFWIGLIGGLDLWRAFKHDGSTISELLSSITNTPTGRLAFLASLGVFAVHILYKPKAPR